jgi:hypothetical protein
MNLFQQAWRDLRSGENIDLYLTIVASLVLVGLNLLGLASDAWIAPLTLTVLALLAIGLLVTRHHISRQLRNLALYTGTGLRPRANMASFRQEGKDATEIVVVGISLVSAVIPHLDYLEQKMQRGCKLRFLLLNPQSVGMQAYNLASNIPNVQHDVEQTLNALAVLMQLEKTTKGKCEVRLSEVLLPVGISAFDPNKEGGFMNVEILGYKRHPGDRPHVLLIRARDEKWFDYFRSQYESIWKDSTPWRPAAS